MTVQTGFETPLSYGDPCPVCGDPVKATVEGDGCTSMNDECVQYKRNSPLARFIFHQDHD